MKTESDLLARRGVVGDAEREVRQHDLALIVVLVSQSTNPSVSPLGGLHSAKARRLNRSYGARHLS